MWLFRLFISRLARPPLFPRLLGRRRGRVGCGRGWFEFGDGSFGEGYEFLKFSLEALEFQVIGIYLQAGVDRFKLARKRVNRDSDRDIERRELTWSLNSLTSASRAATSDMIVDEEGYAEGLVRSEKA